MDKKTLAFSIGILIIAGISAFMYKGIDSGGDVRVEEKSSEINFTTRGYFSGDGSSFIYEEPGAPALSATFVFDDASMCRFSEETVPCWTLGASLGEMVKGKRLFVEGVREESEVLVRNIALDIEAERKFGIIRSVKENNKNVLIEIDEVEFLSGEEAVVAGMGDTGCVREKIMDCIPSMNNGFYIRNTDTGTETYIADENTFIATFKNPGAPDLERVSLESFFRKSEDPQSFIVGGYHFMFLSEGMTLSKLEEQYTP